MSSSPILMFVGFAVLLGTLHQVIAAQQAVSSSSTVSSQPTVNPVVTQSTSESYSQVPIGSDKLIGFYRDPKIGVLLTGLPQFANPNGPSFVALFSGVPYYENLKACPANVPGCLLRQIPGTCPYNNTSCIRQEP